MLKEMLAITLALMSHFLTIGSKRWEEKQLLKAARNQPRDFVVLTAAIGREVADAMAELKDVVQKPMRAAGYGRVGAQLASLRFRLCSAALASMQVLIRNPRQNLPYSVFALLQEDDAARLEAWRKLCAIPACMQDQLYGLLREKFPDDNDLLSTDCQAMLTGLAAACAVDISAIEAKHASTREFTMLRSRGWIPNLEAVGSKFCTQRFANLATASEERGAAKKPTGKPAGGGGGPWRAFISDVSAGRKFQDASALSEQYHALSEEQFQHYQEAGEAGKLAHRAGFASFGPRKKRGTDNPRLAPLLLPGDIRADGAIVAPDGPRDQQLLPYKGPTFEDDFEMYNSQLSLSLEKDELTAAEREEIQRFQEDVPSSAQVVASLLPAAELAQGLSRDFFPRTPLGPLGSAGSPSITGFLWRPPTGRLVQARLCTTRTFSLSCR